MQPSSWPIGSYSVVKTSRGCPEVPGIHGWEDGYIHTTFKYPITFDTVGQSQTDLHRMTIFNFHVSDVNSSRHFQMNFCSRVTGYTIDTGTVWPKGNYSILKGRGMDCPSGE